MKSLHWTFRGLLFLPLFWWIYLVFFGDLGAEPVKELNHLTGFTALCYFLANLWIGILWSFSKTKHKWLVFLFKERRFLGVLTFVILVGHLFFYFAMEAFEIQAVRQLFDKTYLILGFSAWIGMALLAATSNNWSLKKLGGLKWKKLHRLVYVVAALITVHIFLIEKADLILFAALTIPTWIAEGVRLLQNNPWRKSEA